MTTGMFFVFSGGEGCGKTTQAKLFYDYLRKSGYSAILTKEPGGDDGVGRDIREILLNPNYKDKINDTAELLLFKANRAQHIAVIIKPAIDQGNIVVCDRFNADNYAYQACGRGAVSDDEFQFLDRMATNGVQPDFYFYLDIDPRVGLARKKKDGVLTRFEKEGLDFHKRVRAGFLRFFEKFADKKRWQKFDGNLPIEELHQQIIEAYEKRFG